MCARKRNSTVASVIRTTLCAVSALTTLPKARSARRCNASRRYWRDLNHFQEEQEAFQNERDSLVLKHMYTTEQLQRLRKTSVYDEVFRIWHDGPFGTINGCRLGRLPGQQVEWAEINAAWGQALLLLHTLATKLHVTFQSYVLLRAAWGQAQTHTHHRRRSPRPPFRALWHRGRRLDIVSSPLAASPGLSAQLSRARALNCMASAHACPKQRPELMCHGTKARMMGAPSSSSPA